MKIKPSRFKVRLDWKSYFKRFCEVHGEPILCGGRLLFRDGWTYSSTDYAGPEFPPPQEPPELLRFQLSYWELRKQRIQEELMELQRHEEMLTNLQASKSVPLQHVVAGWSEEDSKKTKERQALGPTFLAGRIEWLQGDLADCENNLLQLRESNGSPQ